MASLNAQNHIEEALVSAGEAGARVGSFEVILADGGSTDQTLQIGASFPFVRVLDGTDSGVYEGFNRALNAASGELVGFLNADDILLPASLHLAGAQLSANPRSAMVSGDVLSGQQPDTAARLRHSGPLSNEGALFGIPAINGRFFRLAALRSLGPFDETVGLAADRLMMVQFVKADLKGSHVDQPAYFYRSHAGSLTIAGSADSHIRVYEAEVALGRRLVSQSAARSAFNAGYDRYHALSLIRHRFGRFRSGPSGAGTREPLPRPGLVPGALLSWLRWRGRLSGY